MTMLSPHVFSGILDTSAEVITCNLSDEFRPSLSPYLSDLVSKSGLDLGQAIFLGDFVNQKYFLKGASKSDLLSVPGLTYTRSGSRFATNNAGVLVPFASNIPRITDRGLAIDVGTTNYACMPAIGSGWAAAVNGWTFSDSAVLGRDGLPARHAIRSAESTGVGLAITPTNIAVVPGNVVTMDIEVGGADGITTAIVGVRNSVIAWGDNANTVAEILSGPGSIGRAGGLATVSGLSQVTLTRIRVTRTIVTGETGNMYVLVYLGASSQSSSAGLIACPQFTKMNRVSDYIPNTSPSAAAAVEGDVIRITGLPYVWPHALIAEVEPDFSSPLSGICVLQYDAGSDQNRHLIYSDFAALVTSGGINRGASNPGGGNYSQGSPVVLAGFVDGAAVQARSTVRTGGILTLSGPPPVGLSRLCVGLDSGAGTPWRGFIRRIALIAGTVDDLHRANLVALP